MYQTKTSFYLLVVEKDIKKFLHKKIEFWTPCTIPKPHHLKFPIKRVDNNAKNPQNITSAISYPVNSSPPLESIVSFAEESSENLASLSSNSRPSPRDWNAESVDTFDQLSGSEFEFRWDDRNSVKSLGSDDGWDCCCSLDDDDAEWDELQE